MSTFTSLRRTRALHMLGGIFLLACACAAGAADTQPNSPQLTGAQPISIPPFHDKYSELVKQLEAGKTDINYREFRESFLESKQYEVAALQGEELAQLRASLPELMKQSDFAGIIRTTRKMLSIDYTDMLAHKILRQAYKLTGDAQNAQKYHDIEFGLLKSIVDNGDGKSCRTAWPVVKIDEEYFVLQMIGATIKAQSVATDGGICDKMEVVTENGEAVYYFGISKIFERMDKSLSRK